MKTNLILLIILNLWSIYNAIAFFYERKKSKKLLDEIEFFIKNYENKNPLFRIIKGGKHNDKSNNIAS